MRRTTDCLALPARFFLPAASLALAIGVIALPASLPAAAAAPAPPGFKVVGYMPTYQGDIAAIQYSKLTHVIMAFAYPESDGSISNIPSAKLNQMVPLAHAAGVKAFLALGGGARGDQGWIGATGSEASRTALVDACMKAVTDYNLDGIDFDWEYPDGTEQVAGFNAAVKALSARLHAAGKQISAAVTANDWPHSFPTKEAFDWFDFLNIMIYDNPKPHSTTEHVRLSIEYWITGRKLPKEKFILGCPFYNSAGQTYRAIVAADPAAAQLDLNGAEDHNSIPTIRKKTTTALEKTGGIMFWELSQDATGDLSLLSAVDQVADAWVTSTLPVTRSAMGDGPRLVLEGGRLRLKAAGTGNGLDALGRAMLRASAKSARD